jgi:hypothetical protein
MRKLVLALTAATLTIPALPAAAMAQPGAQTQSWRGRDARAYCRKPSGTTGLILGGAAGVLGGRAIDTRGDRTTGSVLGGAIGALLGRQVERNVVNRCR